MVLQTYLFGAAIDPQLASWSGLQSRFERKLEAGAQFPKPAGY